MSLRVCVSDCDCECECVCGAPFYFVCHSRCARYSYLLHTLPGCAPATTRRDASKESLSLPLLLTLLLQQSFWQLRVADKWTGCMCIVLPVAVAAVPAVGVRSCLAAKTLQLQLFDGICKGYTPHTRRYRRSYTPTPPLWALGCCLFGHSFAGALLQPRQCRVAGKRLGEATSK